MTRLRRAAAAAAVALFAVIALGMIYETVAARMDAARYPAPGRPTDVGEYRLHLLCKGTAPGPTVIMVAGGGTPAVVSYVLQDKIAKFARVCSYDRPGLGWSDQAPTPPTFPRQVTDLETLLEKAQVPAPYVFVPESYGALIVTGFAAKHPDKTAGIVFVDGAEPQLWFDAMKEQSGFSADVKGALMQAAWRTGVIRLAFPLLAPAWVEALPSPIGQELRVLYSRPSPGYAEALEAYRHTPAPERPALVSGLLKERPVIVIAHGAKSGELSSAFEAGWAKAQARLAALSRHGRMVVLENAGHEIAQEAPDEVARYVEECWRDAAARARADAN